MLALLFLTVRPSHARPPTPVILISVDTLRADRLSCYGNRCFRTPNIDRLAQRGTLFMEVSCQATLTLPSHASMLSSTYPFVSGVEENGDRVPEDAVTLASVLKKSGYRTAAFVGGFVLDRRFGLDQGFDLYDSPFGLHPQLRPETPNLIRSGSEVEQAATSWLDRNSNSPYFLFLHFYDLHEPYLLAAARARPMSAGYDVELGYVDDLLGKLWDYLAAKGLYEKALIIFTSDHGESLGDHGEETHGYFIYQSTVRVPLVIHWPSASGPFPTAVEDPVSLLDVAPTALQFLQVPQPLTFEGRSLLELSNASGPGPARDVYSESEYAHDHLGASALRSIRIGHYKYIDAPKPELYDLTSDPGERHNLYARRSSTALALRERLLHLRARFEPRQPRSPAGPVTRRAEEELSALGYLALQRPFGDSSKSGSDPKDRLSEYLWYSRAVRLASAGSIPKAAEELRKVLLQDPPNILARFELAVCYFRLRRLDESIKELQETLRLSPDYTRADELLGRIWLEKRNYVQARAQFEHLLSIAPHDYGANYNLGELAAMAGQWDRAVKRLRDAVQADRTSAEAHNALGAAYLHRGDLEAARSEFDAALHLEPSFARAHYNLGRVFALQKRTEEAAREFRRALAANPRDQEAHEALEGLKKGMP